VHIILFSNQCIQIKIGCIPKPHFPLRLCLRVACSTTLPDISYGEIGTSSLEYPLSQPVLIFKRIDKLIKDGEGFP